MAELDGVKMKRVDLALPEFGFIVATRAALGAGVALLASGRLGKRERRRLGAVLFGIGALTTIPALLLVFGEEPPLDLDEPAGDDC